MKNISRPQYYRVKRILEMVREGTRTGRYPNTGTFCAELEVSRPTVMRDLDFLKYEENAPIAYVPSRFGYRLTDPTWSLPPAQLSRQEVFAFSIARKLLERFQGTALDLDMRSVLNKIAESLEGTITVDLESLSRRMWQSISGSESGIRLRPVYPLLRRDKSESEDDRAAGWSPGVETEDPRTRA